MEHRHSFTAVVTLWLISMGWLGMTKIAPLFQGNGNPPQALPLPAVGEAATSNCWRIEFHGRQIGWASSTITRLGDGAATVVSSVRFDDLPLNEMLSKVLGPIGAMVRASLGDVSRLSAGLEVGSRMSLAADGTLQHFESHVDVDQMKSLVHLRGKVLDGQLAITARIGTSWGLLESDDGDSFNGQVFQTTVDLGEQNFVVDSMSPVVQLKQLKIGQRWQFQAYHPFPPNQPMRLIEATVEGTELMRCGGGGNGSTSMQPTFVVAFRDVSGSGLTSARDPFSKLWVQRDGTVIQQQLRISQLEVTFVLTDSDDCGERDVRQGPDGD